MQKIIGALAFAAALIAFVSPASAADRHACVLKLMAENHFSVADVTRIPPTRHLIYGGQDVGTLPSGSSLWNACAYVPKMALLLASKREARQAIVSNQGAYFGAYLKKSSAHAAIAIENGELKKQLLALRVRNNQETQRGALFFGIATLLALLLFMTEHDRRTHAADNSRLSLENVALRSAIATARARLAKSASDHAIAADRIASLEQALEDAAIPRLGSQLQITLDPEVRGSGKTEKGSFPVTIAGYDLVSTSGGPRLNLKAAPPWLAPEEAKEKAVVIRSLDLATGKSDWRFKGLLTQMHEMQSARDWLKDNDLAWSRPAHMKSKEWIEGAGVSITPLKAAA